MSTELPKVHNESTVSEVEKFEVEESTSVNTYNPMDAIKKRWDAFSFDKISFRTWCIIGALFLSGVVVLVTCVSVSFSYIEWNEYALKRNTATNKVLFEDGVYETGRYYWGLAKSPIRFKNTVSVVDFSASNGDPLVIFTEGGLQMSIDCSFQWRVIRDQIPNLYRNYALSYPTQIESISRSILKNIAPKYTMEDYYQRRPNITIDMATSLMTGLLEKMHVEVTAFQLNYVSLPSLVLDRYLNIAVQSQSNIQENYVQQALLVRQQTSNLAASILANATVINATATSEASYIADVANARAFQMIQDAKRDGYATLFTALGLNTTELQLSFLYVTGLAMAEDLKLLVGVNSVLLT